MDEIRQFFARAWVRDALERVVWTFIQGALGVASIDALATGDASAWTAALAGGAAAVLSLLKAIAARRVGDPESASMLRVWHAGAPPTFDHSPEAD